MESNSEENPSDSGLSSNAIKLIAIFAMTLDHVAWIIYPGYSLNIFAIILHSIGRITAPIMCFFIAEGFYRTRNLKKYAIRLFLLFVISHFAYNWFCGNSFIPFRNSVFGQTSIIWGLFCGLILLILWQKTESRIYLKFIFLLMAGIVSIPSDWTFIAPFSIFLIGLNHYNRKKQLISLSSMLILFSVIYFLYWDRVYGILQLSSLLSIPILMFYNGKRGKSKGMKWLFYVYYPLHLVLLKIIQNILM